jgi:hypothetical protein
MARRKERLVFTGFFIMTMLKLITNPYPTLHDLNCAFVFLMLNITLVIHYVEGFYTLLIILTYAVIQSCFLWVTWMERFSGNANFFYF